VREVFAEDTTQDAGNKRPRLLGCPGVDLTVFEAPAMSLPTTKLVVA
jgi:hypothetical protein